MNKERVLYFDILKVIAIFAVIVNHSWWFLPSSTLTEYSIQSTILMLVKFAVPIFLMVTGALMLKKELTYKEIFLKRIVRVVVPLIVITIMWSLYNHQSIFEIIPNLIRQTNQLITPYWAWYIYSLIGLYMVMPFIQKMINNFQEKDFKMFILLFLIIPSALFFIENISFNFWGKNIFISQGITGVWFPQLIGFVITGYYLSNKNITLRETKIAIIAVVISILVATLTHVFNFETIGNKTFILDSVYFITTVVPSIAIFIIFKYYFKTGFKTAKLNVFFVKASECVFGIYLFHVFVILLLTKTSFFDTLLKFNGYIGTLIIDVLTFIILLVSVYFLRKIPLLKKYL